METVLKVQQELNRLLRETDPELLYKLIHDNKDLINRALICYRLSLEPH